MWTHNWPAPSVSSFIAQLVEHRNGIARSRVQTLLKSWIFFSGFFTQLHKLCSLRRSFLHFHFISAVHIWFISYIINKIFLSLICFRKLWLWNPGAYWSRNKVWPNHWYLWHGFLCGPWSSWIQRGKEKKSQSSRGISTQDYQGRVHEVVPAEGMSKALNNLYLLWGVTVTSMC